jgi:hypothetical protein
MSQAVPTGIARISAVVFAVVALFLPSQAANAFGLNFGPFHLNLSFPGEQPRSHVARTEPSAPSPGAPSVGATGSGAPNAGPPGAAEAPRSGVSPAGLPRGGPPALLFSVLAWPALEDEIFSPSASSPWLFGYESIFDQAFAKYPAQASADLCPYRDSTAAIVGRIAQETSPDAQQRPLLQNLATALGQANGYLVKSCPKDIPAQPVARLQLMNGQIDAAIMALEIVRPELQKFEQALTNEQRARLDGAGPALDGIAPACKLRAGSPRESLARLEQAVQPTADQSAALTKAEDAFNRAASDLDADCPGNVSRTVVGRLEATEARLDATWRAVQTIDVALAEFQKSLSDEQNARLNSLELVSLR